MIEIKHLTKTFDDATILKDINTTINNGDVIAVIGPSGAGKSTFIRCLNLLNTPSSGQIILDGDDITAEGTDVNMVRRRIGMVFQQFNLFRNLTVLENVILPQMDILGRSRQEACDIAIKNLKTVGMYDRILKYPSSLSGGQQQRVAIARTLSMDPEVILFDEPTSALDPTLVGEVEYTIGKLAEEGRTMVIVTHEMRFARKVANKVFYMDEGLIYEEGTPDRIFNHPMKEKTRRFVSRSKYLEIILHRQNGDIPEIFSKIAIFGDSLEMKEKDVNKIQMVFEELCIESVLPTLGKDEQLRVTFESSEEEDDIKMIIYCNGNRIKEESENTVAGKMFRFAADSIEYSDSEIKITINK